MAEKIIMTLSH